MLPALSTISHSKTLRTKKTMPLRLRHELLEREDSTSFREVGKIIEPLPIELVEEEEDCSPDLPAPPQGFLGYLPVPCQEPESGQARPVKRSMVLELRRRGFSLLQSLRFQVITVSSILLNAVVIGFETDMPDLPCWLFVENAFLVGFTLEVGLRIFVYGPRAFFCGKVPSLNRSSAKAKAFASTMANKAQKDENVSDVVWNIFDFFVVACGFLQELLRHVAKSSTPNNEPGNNEALLLRTLRILRLLRVLRVVRVVRFLKQLYLLAYGFMEGGMAVFWVALMAASLIYLCAIVLVRSFHATPKDAPTYEFFESHFYSVPGAMFTLFEIMASPTLGSYREVLGQCPLLTLFIVLFVIFGSFGMNGLLTGVISESIMEKNRARIEAQRQEREAKRRLLETSCSALFDEVVGDPGDRMTLEQFRRCREEICMLLESAEASVPSDDLFGMFLAMDYSNSGTLEKVDFVRGILELCEDVRPMSIMEIHCQLLKSQLQMDKYHALVEQLLLMASDGAEQPNCGRKRVPKVTRELTMRDYQSEGGLPVDVETAGDKELQQLGHLQRRLAAAASAKPQGEAAKGLAVLGRKLARLAQANAELLEDAVAGCHSARSCAF